MTPKELDEIKNTTKQSAVPLNPPKQFTELTMPKKALSGSFSNQIIRRDRLLTTRIPDRTCIICEEHEIKE